MAGLIHSAILLAVFNLGGQADTGSTTDPPPVGGERKADSPLAGKIAALKDAMGASERNLSRDLAAARKAGAQLGSKEIKDVLARYARDWQGIADEALSLVRSHPSDPAAFDGVLLVGADFNDDVVEIIRKNFMHDPRMGQLCASLSNRKADSSKRLLRDIASQNRDRT